jgi:hypothetical protein
MAVLSAILSLGMKNDDFFVTPSYILEKLYTNNLLMIFNSRLHIERGRNGRPSEDPSFASFSKPSASMTIGSSYGSRIVNNVQTDDNFIDMKGLVKV